MKNNGFQTLQRDSHDYKLGRKGPVQHDVLAEEYADAFQDGDMIHIKVNCSQDATGLSVSEPIPYGLSVIENVTTEIYEDIRLRLQQRIQT